MHTYGFLKIFFMRLKKGKKILKIIRTKIFITGFTLYYYYYFQSTFLHFRLGKLVCIDIAFMITVPSSGKTSN